MPISNNRIFGRKKNSSASSRLGVCELVSVNRVKALLRAATYWGHRTVTYFNAAGSLVAGFKHVHRLHGWGMAIKSAMGLLSKHVSLGVRAKNAR